MAKIVGVVVSLLTIVGAVWAASQTIPTKDEVAREINTVMLAQASKHDMDWLDNRIRILLVEIRALETKQEQFGLSESEKWQLQSLRDQMQELEKQRYQH